MGEGYFLDISKAFHTKLLHMVLIACTGNINVESMNIKADVFDASRCWLMMAIKLLL